MLDVLVADVLLDRLIDVNRRALQHLKRVGRLPAEVPLQVADTLTWAFERSCHQLIRGHRPAQLNALIEALTHMVWSSMYVVRSLTARSGSHAQEVAEAGGFSDKLRVWQRTSASAP